MSLFLSPGAGTHHWVTYTREVLGREIVRFQYLKVGLRDLKAKDYLAMGSPLASALAALMQRGEGGKAKLKANCMEGVMKSPIDPARKGLLTFVVESHLRLSPEETQEYEQMIAQPDLRKVSNYLG